MSERKYLHFGYKADAYLEWAQHTGFKHFDSVLPDDVGKQVGLLVQWSSDAPSAVDLRELRKIGSLTMARVYDDQPVASITIRQTDLATLFSSMKNIRHLELATPVASSDAASVPIVPMQIELSDDAPQVLLGCIDDGFPIASRRFFSGKTLRIARFWNQESADSAQGEPPAASSAHPKRTEFGYGWELIPKKLLHALSSGPAQVAGFSSGCELPNANDSADDTRYYQRMHLRRSLHRVTHGAHVLDIFAGQTPVRSRIPASRDLLNGDLLNGDDGSATKPPSRAREAGLAAAAPIVLVQLPKYALEDPSGRWLGRNVLDGLHYVLQTARLRPDIDGAAAIKNIIVNLSWGPQTGPHDGSSLLELAICQLIQKEKGRGCNLEVIVPAGNSYEARAHAEFRACDGTKESICWCVPPGSGSPAFLEVWWPKGTQAENATLTVTAPDGSRLESNGCGIWSTGMNGHHDRVRWGVVQVERGGNVMALIALAPTGSHINGAALAPHGAWRVDVSAIDTIEEPVHIYVARSNHNMGTRRRAQPSYLRDVAYEQMRQTRDAERTDPVPGSVIQKHGSLNGIGTANAIGVAAGYRMSDGQPTRYSSGGPSRGPRLGPDWAYPTDVSRMVRGLPATGTRAGTVVNLVGTSSAAPQYARDETNAVGSPTGTPRSGPAIDPRTGRGKR